MIIQLDSSRTARKVLRTRERKEVQRPIIIKHVCMYIKIRKRLVVLHSQFSEENVVVYKFPILVYHLAKARI